MHVSCNLYNQYGFELSQAENRTHCRSAHPDNGKKNAVGALKAKDSDIHKNTQRHTVHTIVSW